MPIENEYPQGEEALNQHERLMHDLSLTTISFRRHGAYERGDTEGKEHLKGQLTTETFGAVREAAQEWVSSLPESVDVNIIASPTFMPAERPVSEAAKELHPTATTAINPRRASVTSALYADELRNRFGEEFGGYLATDDLSEQAQAARKVLNLPEPENARRLDGRLGDIFEFTTKDEAANIPAFFKTLAQSEYKGMRPEFWHDFIRGKLPQDLNDIYLKSGGDSAVKKASMALGVVSDAMDSGEHHEKQVDLLVSHEEVIGSLAYQILGYLRDNNLVTEAQIEQLEGNKVGYNQGFDLHIDSAGNMTVDIAGLQISDLSFEQLKEYVDGKVVAEDID